MARARTREDEAGPKDLAIMAGIVIAATDLSTRTVRAPALSSAEKVGQSRAEFSEVLLRQSAR
jgi:hypothetical protein